MRIFLALCLALVAQQASAQTFQVDKLTGNTVFMAVQCDIGRFAAKPQYMVGIDPLMKAHVIYNWKVEKNTNVSASAKFSFIKWLIEGPSVEAAAKFTKTDENTLDGAFNMNEGNTGACQEKDKPRVPVGVYKCLANNTLLLRSKKTAKCNSDRIAYGKVAASGKVKWVFVEAGPEIGYDVKVTYNIKIDAPAKDDKKAEK